MEEKIYKIVTEKKYVTEYQSEYVRAKIVDENNQEIRKGEFFFSEEEALADGKRMIEELKQTDKLYSYGINFTRRVFTDPKGTEKMLKYGLQIVFLPTVIIITLTLITYNEKYIDITMLISIFIIMILMAYYGFNQFNFGGNMVNYVLYDGNLYRIFIPKEHTEEAVLAMKYLPGGIGAMASVSAIVQDEQERKRKQELMKQNAFLKSLLNKRDTWKIIDVTKILQKKNYYKIYCLIEQGNNKKKKMKKLYIRNGYNDYDSLINCFKYLQVVCNNQDKKEEK